MTFSKKILSLCVIILLFMAGVAGLYWDSYFFVVKKTKVSFLNTQVNASVKEEAAQKAELSLKKLYGENIWRLNLEQVQTTLLENNWLESVSIVRDLPDALRIEVKFKTIVFLFMNSKQQLMPVSADGDLLNPLPPTLAPDVPVIKNINLIKNKAILKRITALYLQLPHDGFITQRNISEVDWSESEGFKVELTHSEDGFIVLGFDQVSAKAKRVESVLKYLESQKQRWRVIDASFSKKVLVRLRKRS